MSIKLPLERRFSKEPQFKLQFHKSFKPALASKKWLLVFFTHFLWSEHQEGEDLQASINICEARNKVSSETSLKLMFCFGLFTGLVLTQISCPID